MLWLRFFYSGSICRATALCPHGWPQGKADDYGIIAGGAHYDVGELRIGASCLRLSDFLRYIIPAFHTYVFIDIHYMCFAILETVQPRGTC